MKTLVAKAALAVGFVTAACSAEASPSMLDAPLLVQNISPDLRSNLVAGFSAEVQGHVIQLFVESGVESHINGEQIQRVGQLVATAATSNPEFDLYVSANNDPIYDPGEQVIRTRPRLRDSTEHALVVTEDPVEEITGSSPAVTQIDANNLSDPTVSFMSVSLPVGNNEYLRESHVSTRFAAFVIETCQAMVYVDVQVPNLPNHSDAEILYGNETFCNMAGKAIAFTLSGASYETYLANIQGHPFEMIAERDNTTVPNRRLSQEAYDAIAQGNTGIVLEFVPIESNFVPSA